MVNREVKPELLSVIEAEAATGISRWSWRRMAYDGRISSVKISTRLLIPRTEIDRLTINEGTFPTTRRRLHG